MSKEFVNAFIAPAKRIWDLELGYPLEIKRVDTVTSKITTDDVSVYISLSGEAAGVVVYGFNARTAKAIAAKMIEDEVEVLDDLAYSALGELGNMITVHASSELSGAGFKSTFDPPLLVAPVGRQIPGMPNPHIRTMFASEVGNLNIHIGLVTDTKFNELDWLWNQWK